MHRLRVYAIALSLLGAATVTAEGQARAVTTLRIGDRLRIRTIYSSGSAFIGPLQRRDSAEVVLGQTETSDSASFRWSEIRTIDRSVREYSRGEGAGHGAYTGLKIGLITTAVLTAVGFWVDTHPHGETFIPATYVGAVIGLLFTGVTTLSGSFLGASAPGDEWVRVYPP